MALQKDKPLLSIVVPTFNRPASLENVLQKLRHQLLENVQLVVVDNASKVDPRENSIAVRELIAEGKLQLHRNPTNIGADANILRAVEYAAGEYLWVLGDDDAPEDDALATILSTLEVHPGVDYFNFSTGMFERKLLLCGTGMLEFSRHLDSFSNALLISASVYRRQMLLKNLSTGYNMLSYHSQNFGIALSAIIEGATYALCPKRIVAWGHGKTSWDSADVSSKLPLILDHLRFPGETGDFVLAQLKQSLPTNEHFAAKLLQRCTADPENATFYRRQYKNIIARAFRLAWFDRIKYLAYSQLFAFPRIAVKILALVKRG